MVFLIALSDPGGALAQSAAICGEGGAYCPTIVPPPDDPTFVSPPVITRAVDGCGLVVWVDGVSAYADKVILYDSTAHPIHRWELEEEPVSSLTVHLPSESGSSVGGRVYAIQIAGEAISAAALYDIQPRGTYLTPGLVSSVYECAFYSSAGGMMPGADLDWAYDPAGSVPSSWSYRGQVGYTGLTLTTAPFSDRTLTAPGTATTARWSCSQLAIPWQVTPSQAAVPYGAAVLPPSIAPMQDSLGTSLTAHLVEWQRSVRLNDVIPGAAVHVTDAMGLEFVQGAAGIWPVGPDAQVDVPLTEPIALGSSYDVGQELCSASDTIGPSVIPCASAPPPVAYGVLAGDQFVRFRQYIPGWEIRIYLGGIEVGQGRGPIVYLDPAVSLAVGDTLTILHEGIESRVFDEVTGTWAITTCPATHGNTVPVAETCTRMGDAFDPGNPYQAPCCGSLVDRRVDYTEDDDGISGPRFCLPSCGEEDLEPLMCGDGRVVQYECTEEGAMPTTPLTEEGPACDGVDQNCDGRVDENYEGAAASIPPGLISACYALADTYFPGQYQCEAGSESLVPVGHCEVRVTGTSSWESISDGADPDSGSRWGDCTGWDNSRGSELIYCDGSYDDNPAPAGFELTPWWHWNEGDSEDLEGINIFHSMCPPHMACTGEFPNPLRPGGVGRFCQVNPACAIEGEPSSLCWAPYADGNSYTPPWPPSDGNCGVRE